MPHRTLATVVLSLTLTAGLAAQQQVFVVDEQGGPGSHFTDLAQAVAAVPDGSALIVRPGSYAMFTLDGKGLSIAGEDRDSVFIDGAGAASGGLTFKRTSTSQEVYQQNQEQGLLMMESADFAGIVLRADRGETLSPVDSIRYDSYLNVWVNLYEAVYTNALQGTMEQEMAAGWLAGMGSLRCEAGMAAYWTRKQNEYHRAFRVAMDSAFAATRCPD